MLKWVNYFNNDDDGDQDINDNINDYMLVMNEPSSYIQTTRKKQLNSDIIRRKR